MSKEHKWVTYYKSAREAVLSGDNSMSETAVVNLRAFIKYLQEETYAASDSIRSSAKCLGLIDDLKVVVKCIEKYGITNEEVKKYFNAFAPTYGADIAEKPGESAKARSSSGADKSAGGVKKDPVKAIADMIGSGRGGKDAPPQGTVGSDGGSEPVKAGAEGINPAVKSDGSVHKPADKSALPKQDKGVPAAGNPAVSVPSERSAGALHPNAPANADGETAGSGISFSPQRLSEFIGQTQIVTRILREISAARKKGRGYIDNILLFGNRGLGKSTLMELIAKELDAEYEFLDATSLNNDVTSKKKIQKFFIMISQAQKPVVIAIDEIHALPQDIQTSLLTLLQSRKFSYMDSNGVNYEYPVKEFTFIGATTDPDKVLPTIKDRCTNLTFYLRDYTDDELRRIFENKFAAVGLTAADDVITDCIVRCRSSIREVEAFVKGMDTLAVTHEPRVTEVTKEISDVYFEEREIDSMGLQSKDREIIRALYEDTTGAMSADTLGARVHLDTKVLTGEFEPYLLKIAFVNIVRQGRTLTERGRKYWENLDEKYKANLPAIATVDEPDEDAAPAHEDTPEEEFPAAPSVPETPPQPAEPAGAETPAGPGMEPSPAVSAEPQAEPSSTEGTEDEPAASEKESDTGVAEEPGSVSGTVPEPGDSNAVAEEGNEEK